MGVSHSVTEIHQARHRFGGQGQMIGEVCKSISVAIHHAEELGVKTDCDDWATVVAESGEHWVEFFAPLPKGAGGG